jgi:hypothetical protein
MKAASPAPGKNSRLRSRLVISLLVVAGAALLAGAAPPAGAVPSGTERALHCTSAFSFLQTFVAAGSGSVFPPSGLRTCGTVVQITATPAQNFRFIGWVGFCSGTANPCNLFMGESSDHFTYSVGARFERIRQTVTVQKSGNGTVRSDPGGIDCGNTCQGDFDQGSQVAFDAIPASGNQFNGWGGACASAQRNTRCVITIPASSVTVTASFGPPPVQLTVSKTGRGSITSSPAGISCGTTCSFAFASGSQVTLTATPEPEYPFQGWGGACSGTAPTCRLTLTAAASVSAQFSSGKIDNLAAGFRGRWSRSLYTGSLVLRGTATAEVQLTARIASESPVALRTPQSTAIDQTFQFSVPAGPFERLFPLPKTGFYPGRYSISLTGTSGGAPTIARTGSARMEPPGEGIVSRAWVTAGRRTLTRAPRGTKRLVAHFVYVAKPFRGSSVTVSWFLGRRALGTVKKIRWKPIVTTDVKSTSGLPSGRYRCVLRARGLVVYEVSVRVG